MQQRFSLKDFTLCLPLVSIRVQDKLPAVLRYRCRVPSTAVLLKLEEMPTGRVSFECPLPRAFFLAREAQPHLPLGRRDQLHRARTGQRQCDNSAVGHSELKRTRDALPRNHVASFALEPFRWPSRHHLNDDQLRLSLLKPPRHCHAVDQLSLGVRGKDDWSVENVDYIPSPGVDRNKSASLSAVDADDLFVALIRPVR